MYIKARCPVCMEEIYFDVTLELEREKVSGEQLYKYLLTNINTDGTVSEKDLIKSVLQSLYGQIHNGIEIEVVENLLQDKYGITGPCCKEFIEKIRLELNMYSPDMKTLYFV